MKIFIITGEKSGDLLASKVINQLKKNYKNLELKGCGGEHLAKENIKNIFAQKEINLMGFFEVIPSLFKILKLINFTVAEIIKFKPDIVITVDAPDFNFRVTKKLKKLNFKTKYIHVVAPTVWAYREYRAKKIAKIYDLLLVLFPFEPPYFEKYNLKTKFIGHPLIFEQYRIDKEIISPKLLKNKLPLLVLTLGSRDQEVKTLLPIYLEVISKLKARGLKFTTAIPTFNKYINLIKASFPDALITTNQDDKYFAFKNAVAVIAKSGTNNFEIAKAKAPFSICYKVNLFTYILLKLMVKTKYVNLINILAKKEIIAEFIQYKCKADLITEHTYMLMTDDTYRKEQIIAQNLYLKDFVNNNQDPSKIAAEEIIKLAKPF